MTFKLEDFEKSTALLFGSPEGKAWLRMAKHHPQIKYWYPSSVSGQGQDNGTSYWDGAKTPFRIVDLILDNSK